jgi:predicted RNA-binding Zn-ribbon protein involved in translation (DUF1610 family)
MQKIPQCDHCLFSSHDYHLLCAVHPAGSPEDSCPDFEADPELEGKRFVDFLGLQRPPEAPSCYNGQLVLQPRQRWTQEEQLQLLETHPLFTGRCPECGARIERDYSARVHFDCTECGWMDDSV